MRSRSRPVVYPCSDGQPMTDHDLNRALMEYVELALAGHFDGDPMVYVSANHFIYYEEGNRNARVAPDVYVVKGVVKRIRGQYLLWEEGRPPDVAFEFVSKLSLRRDLVEKRLRYERLGIAEYYVFDPRGLLREPTRLHAFRLREGRYEEVLAERGVHSPALGLDLEVDGQWLWLRDPANGVRLPTHAEALARAQQEADRARELEAEVDRLRRRLGEGA